MGVNRPRYFIIVTLCDRTVIIISLSVFGAVCDNNVLLLLLLLLLLHMKTSTGRRRASLQ